MQQVRVFWLFVKVGSVVNRFGKRVAAGKRHLIRESLIQGQRQPVINRTGVVLPLEKHYRRIRRRRWFRVWLLHDWCPNADCSLLDNRSILLTGSRAAGARCVAYVWLHGAREGSKSQSMPFFTGLCSPWGLARYQFITTNTR